MPGGELVCKLKGAKVVIPAQDELGRTIFNGERMEMQKALDSAYLLLREKHINQQPLWDLSIAKRWGRKPASEKQKQLISRKGVRVDLENLTCLQASQILNRVLYA